MKSIREIQDINELHARLDQYYKDIAPIVAERCRLNGMIENIILHEDGTVEYVLPKKIKEIDKKYEELMSTLLEMYVPETTQIKKATPTGDKES